MWRPKKKTTTTSTPPTKPKKTGARPKRPLDLHAALDEINLQRPEHVPESALTLVAWVTIPGDNTQRGQHWTFKRSWQEPVIIDLGACLAIQPHPGVIKNPGLHIRLIVPSRGDANNSLARAKFLIDKLQVRREVQYRKPEGGTGIRVHGLLGLIDDDKVLTDANRTIEEVASRAMPERNLQKAILWIWDKGEI